ncbi:MAG TPA: hypothetical protein VFF37_10900, partial [Streptomyces sp.]|nr:hypothetical protein [Streptomyces sp.]
MTMVTGAVPSVATSTDAEAPVVLVCRRLDTETDFTRTGGVVGADGLVSVGGADVGVGEAAVDEGAGDG